MKVSMKWIVGIAAFLLLLTGAYFMSKISKRPGVTPIKIGVVAPMTGDLAFLGDGIKQAILLAKANLGNTRYSYEVIFEDDQMDPKMTINSVNKLISIDKVDAIVSFSSGTGNIISPIAEQNKIVHFGIASDPNVAKGVYNFIDWTPPAEENKVFVAELQHRGISKLGVFEQNTQGANSVMSDLRGRLKDAGIEIVTDQTFNTGDKDFRSIIAKTKYSGAETYLLMAFSPEIEILTKQIKEAGITASLTSIESFELSEQMNLFEGQWYVNAADPSKNFIDKFFAQTGKNPTLGTANAYDMFNLIAAATEKISGSAKPSTEQIANELLKINNFNGAMGNLSIDADGIVVSKAEVRMIKNGIPVTISQ